MSVAKQGVATVTPPMQPAGTKTKPGKGFRLFTVRQWRSGPHIKLQDGWYPYRPGERKYQTREGKWVPLPGKPEPGLIAPEQMRRYNRLLKKVVSGLKRGKVSHKRALGIGSRLLDKLTKVHSRLKQIDKDLAQRFLGSYGLQLLEPLRKEAEVGGKQEVAKFVEWLEARTSRRDYARLFAVADTIAKVREEFRQRRHKPGSADKEAMQRIPGFRHLADTADVSMYGEQGSVGATLLRETASGQKAIYKQDILAQLPDRIRDHIDPEIPLSAREEAAYAVASLMNLDVVPATTLVDDYPPDEGIVIDALKTFSLPSNNPESRGIDPDKKYQGSSQDFVHGRTWAEEYGSLIITESLSEKQYKQMEQIAVLDYLIGNMDRHANNVMVDKDKNLKAIDNSLSFPTIPAEDIVWSMVVSEMRGKILSPETSDKVRGLDEKKLASTLYERGFSEKEVGGALVRLERLKKGDVFILSR